MSDGSARLAEVIEKLNAFGDTPVYIPGALRERWPLMKEALRLALAEVERFQAALPLLEAAIAEYKADIAAHQEWQRVADKVMSSMRERDAKFREALAEALKRTPVCTCARPCPPTCWRGVAYALLAPAKDGG